MMSNAELATNRREEFRNTMAEYFYQINDNETYQDILTESHERLMLDAYLYAIEYFKHCIKEL